jgi:hypothetical protein
MNLPELTFFLPEKQLLFGPSNRSSRDPVMRGESEALLALRVGSAGNLFSISDSSNADPIKCNRKIRSYLVRFSSAFVARYKESFFSTKKILNFDKIH